MRQLWLTVALLMLLTPLGVLAVGTAWGEWSPKDFVNPAARTSIVTASRSQNPPPIAPAGLQRLSTLWTAPFPGYAPTFIRSTEFGYLLSAMFGVGFLVLASFVANAVTRNWRGRDMPS